jgi:hypothetical protein
MIFWKRFLKSFIIIACLGYLITCFIGNEWYNPMQIFGTQVVVSDFSNMNIRYHIEGGSLVGEEPSITKYEYESNTPGRIIFLIGLIICTMIAGGVFDESKKETEIEETKEDK